MKEKNEQKQTDAQNQQAAVAPGLKQDEIYEIDPTTESVDIHELAALFPKLEGNEFEQLKSSIEKGQQNPIIMHGKILLDGRNRYNACWELGIPVKAIQWDGSGTVEELILAQNLQRRHLSASQRAALAVKLLPALEQQAAERMKAGTALYPADEDPLGQLQFRRTQHPAQYQSGQEAA